MTLRRYLLALIVLLSFVLMGCDSKSCEYGEYPVRGEYIDYCASLDSYVSPAPKPRYKVEIVEAINSDSYIVEKVGYVVSGVYLLETNNENYVIGDIIYVVQIDDYTVNVFSEWYELQQDGVE